MNMRGPIEDRQVRRTAAGFNHALQRPAIASRLQSNALVGRVAELGA